MAEDTQDAAEETGKKGKRRAKAPSEPANMAATASCLTGLVLLTLVLCTWVYVTFFDDSILPSWEWWHWLVMSVLLLVIPIVVFRAVTLWILGEGPRFVDIDFSWRAGIDAMAKQGITLKSAPLYLIIGGGSEKLRRNLMAASGIPFRVNGVPDRPAPLHWYASDNAIFLFLDDAAWSSLAARKYRMAARAPNQPAGPAPPSGGPAPPMTATLVPGSGPSAAPTPPPSLAPDSAEAPPGGAPSRPGPSSRPVYMGTLSPDQITAPNPGQKAASAAPPPRRVRRPGSEEAANQLRRLEAVCAKLRRYRQPVCPLNGMLMLLPFDLLQASRADIEEVERAISADLGTAQRELEIRCPVTALIVAMEQERGFCELIRRIGHEHAARQRFGQRFDIRREPSVEELKRFSTYACGVFEDWVYSLFRDEQVLSHAGNPALYNLLCKVRRSFQARLSDVLSKGFGHDIESTEEPILFSGCYFAATGGKPERQAFVSGVLTKLQEEQEALQWTDSALDNDSRRGMIAKLGWAVSAVLALALAALFIPQLAG